MMRVYIQPSLAGVGGLAVCSLAFKNLQEFMPSNTMTSSSTSPLLVRELRCRYSLLTGLCVVYDCCGIYRNNSNELPQSSIVSLSIVKTGQRYNSSNARLKLEEPVLINYANVQVWYQYRSLIYMCIHYLMFQYELIACPLYSLSKMPNSGVRFGSLGCRSLYEYSLEHTSNLFYMYMYSNSDIGFWSSSGVRTHVLNDTNILCNSSHLTSFSVLVTVQDPAVRSTHALSPY